MKLTKTIVETIERPGRYSDDRAPGLMLFVQRREPQPGKVWITRTFVQRLTVAGRRRDIGLGSPKWLSLTEARRMAIENYRVARAGQDPTRKRASVPTFEEAADAVIGMHSGTWRDGGKTEARWRATLATYAYPRLGRRSVADITTSDVLAVLTHDGFWSTKRETARKVRQRISTIMDWAAAEGHRTDNPCNALKAALPKAGHKTQHRAPYPTTA